MWPFKKKPSMEATYTTEDLHNAEKRIEDAERRIEAECKSYDGFCVDPRCDTEHYTGRTTQGRMRNNV